MNADTQARCWWCANPSTDAHPIVPLSTLDPDCEKDVPVHDTTYLDDPSVEPYNCSPIPDGYARCHECLHASAMDDLDEQWEVFKDQRPDSTDMTTKWARRYHLRGFDQDELRMPLDGGEVRKRFYHPTCDPAHWRQEADRKQDVAPTADEAKASRDEERWEAIPTEAPGASIADLAKVWGVKDPMARAQLKKYADRDALQVVETPTPAGGAPRKTYWREEVES